MSSTSTNKKAINPPQQQNVQPGSESRMQPAPIYSRPDYKPAGKLADKVAIVTGGDSGIGRAVSVMYAQEGCRVTIAYLNENKDAQDTKVAIEALGGECLLVAGDIGDEAFCQQLVQKTVEQYGKLDIVVNNAAEQHVQQQLTDISAEQLEKTFRTNVFAMFYLSKAAMPHLGAGSCIINTASITAYRGNPTLMDYSSTKGAIVSFTRALAVNLAGQGIRVNGVAPGPVWTPLIPATMDAQTVAEFGSDTPMQRPGQPHELAAAYVYLGCDDSSYMTGQFLHINGGEVVNG